MVIEHPAAEAPTCPTAPVPPSVPLNRCGRLYADVQKSERSVTACPVHLQECTCRNAAALRHVGTQAGDLFGVQANGLGFDSHQSERLFGRSSGCTTGAVSGGPVFWAQRLRDARRGPPPKTPRWPCGPGPVVAWSAFTTCPFT